MVQKIQDKMGRELWRRTLQGKKPHQTVRDIRTELPSGDLADAAGQIENLS